MNKRIKDLFTTPAGREKIGQCFVIFILVFVIFLAIEILPLHFGNQHLSWSELLPEISRRLPRIFLIGVVIALIGAIPAREKDKGGPVE